MHETNGTTLRGRQDRDPLSDRMHRNRAGKRVTETSIDPQFEALLEHLKEDRGFDFSGYKRGTLERRIKKRMYEVRVQSYGEYVRYLQANLDEFASLFNTILINVTEFFRDRPAWDFVIAEIVPRLLKERRPLDPVRVWSAGCASGEEAYTIAMILCEAMGVDAFKSRVKIYATDVDDEALQRGRHAIYSESAIEGVPPELVERYFERLDGQYAFRKDLRRAVIFGRHDLLQDAPISRLDLLICRNTLMYFNAQVQTKILSRFHFALKDEGYLFLGKAEMLVSHAKLFTPVDPKWRVFTRVPNLSIRDRLDSMNYPRSFRRTIQNGDHLRLREIVFDAGLFPQVVVDREGVLIFANALARVSFGLTSRQVGMPLRDLELSYRPLDLRSLIDQAFTERQLVTSDHIDWRDTEGNSESMQVIVLPLGDDGAPPIGVSIFFIDTTQVVHLEMQLEHSNQDLEAAYEEVQSVNEELETTNEELHSSVEELETTNEELQSTNEELETMNEELQSTNEELETINVELQVRTADLNSANVMMESILSKSQVGVIVVDRDMRVVVWNRRSEDLWGLRVGEVQGQHLLNLDIGLAVEELRPPIRTCLNDPNAQVRVELLATNRRGRRIRCEVTCDPLVGSNQIVDGVILWLNEQAPAPVMDEIS